ncbi:hypothetical protein [Nonomuraea turcica]|uniref:hypothetical protein n=1 Tax=Nonomuraea sp. G32 TaxID=3067274 RepID=UPI00273B4108|nr:hypothetical protein [Nonomuraea sp. G32]MDP4508575.1 hypothetical protein [Nonomuraea sp. G32]
MWHLWASCHPLADPDKDRRVDTQFVGTPDQVAKRLRVLRLIPASSRPSPRAAGRPCPDPVPEPY